MNNIMRHKISTDKKDSINHSFLNPFSYYQLRNNKKLLQSIDRWLIDGQLLVKYFKLLGVADVTRKSFDMTSLAPEVFSQAIEKNQSVYFVGTTPEDIVIAVEKIADRFKGLNIIGFHHGYLDDKAKAQLVMSDINNKSADIVIVGMGAPRQESFLINLRNTGWKGTGFTCGGFFHQTASKMDYYPKWADKFNLRWLYRIYDEPKLAKRYFIQYPWALVLIYWDFKIAPFFK